MTLLTNNSAPLTPAEISELVIQPVMDQAVAASAATTILFNTNELRIPVVADGSAAWVAEASEIPIGEPTLSEVILTPRKLADLVVLSNELIADANGDVTKIIGDSVTRSISRKIDQAFWAKTTPALGLKSIGSVNGILEGEFQLSGSDTYLYGLTDAIASLSNNGHTATAIVVSPSTYKYLARIPVRLDPLAGGGNAPLTIAGIPVYVTDALAADTAYVVDSSRIVIGVRTSDVNLELDTSAFFSRDATALRATLRLNAVYPDPSAIVRIDVTP